MPAAGEVRIRVDAAGVNFADIMGRMGMYPDLPPMPVVVGYEVAGRDRRGRRRRRRATGSARDVLALTRFGGYSDVVCVPEAQVVRAARAAWSAEEGAALPVNYLTAWQLLHVMGSLARGRDRCSCTRPAAASASPRSSSRSTLGAQVIGTASAGKHERLARRSASTPASTTRARTSRRACASSRTDAASSSSSTRSAGDSFKKSYRVPRADRAPRHVRPLGRRDRKAAELARASRGRALDARLALHAARADEREQGRLRRQRRPPVGRDRPRRPAGWRSCSRLYREGVVAAGRRRSASRSPRRAEAHHYIQDRKNFGKVLLVP